MSDFIFSTKKTQSSKLTRILKSISKESNQEIEEYHGLWGSLGISRNLYNGFLPYENEDFIAVVIGGPILTFRENNFLNKSNSSEGTKAIFERWEDEKIIWHKDLSGPFVILFINKITKEIMCLTDLMSFIPVYSYTDYNEIVLSTHVDLTAKFTQQTNNKDDISTVDFILNGVITYPYTRYKKVFQIAPSSQHTILDVRVKIKTTNYWLPREENKYKSLDLASKDLRKAIKEYINSVVSQTSNIAQFISAGEDSRLLSGLLKKYPRDAFIFLDNMNREGEIAKKTANIYGANFRLFTRDEFHYLNILPETSKLVGSSAQYLHAHTYGFHNKCNLQSYSAVFGGLFSDALFKGVRINKIRMSGRIPLIPEIRKSKDISVNIINNTIFEKKIITEIIKRRELHLNNIKNFRSDSADEWFELWPSSMNPSIPNLHANRRLFKSYEPFLSNEAVKISAEVPQEWKLNRKLFHQMAKPLLEPSKWLRHSNGWYPYYSWIFKSLINPITYINRKLKTKLGFNKGDQGSWGDKNELVNSEKWNNTIDDYASNAGKFTELLNVDLKKALNSTELDTIQRINFMQVLFMDTEEVNKNNNNTD